MKIQQFLKIKHDKKGLSHESRAISAKNRHEPIGQSSSPRSAPGPKGLFSKDRAFVERHHTRPKKMKVKASGRMKP